MYIYKINFIQNIFISVPIHTKNRKGNANIMFSPNTYFFVKGVLQRVYFSNIFSLLLYTKHKPLNIVVPFSAYCDIFSTHKIPLNVCK